MCHIFRLIKHVTFPTSDKFSEFQTSQTQWEKQIKGVVLADTMTDQGIDRFVGVCKKPMGRFSQRGELWELAKTSKELKSPKHKLKTKCPDVDQNHGSSHGTDN